jgi:hypothetical protein
MHTSKEMKTVNQLDVRSSPIARVWNRYQPRVALCALTLGSVIEPRWGSGGEALLKMDWLHNTYEAPRCQGA